MDKPISNGPSPITPRNLSRIGAKQGAVKTPTGPFDARLKEACADFEGIFINFMLQTMKKTLPGDGVFGSSHQKEIYDTMFFQEISSKLARERSMGIGDAMYRQLRGKIYGQGEK